MLPSATQCMTHLLRIARNISYLVSKILSTYIMSVADMYPRTSSVDGLNPSRMHMEL
jgi:hypothetical protein